MKRRNSSTIPFGYKLLDDNKTLVKVDTTLGRSSIPSSQQIFNNKAILKNVDINLTSINSFRSIVPSVTSLINFLYWLLL